MVPDPQDRQKFLKLLQQALLPLTLLARFFCCKLKNCVTWGWWMLLAHQAIATIVCKNHRLLTHPWFERSTLANPKIVTWVTLLRHHTSSAVGSHNFQCYPSPTLKELLLEAKLFSVLPISHFERTFFLLEAINFSVLPISYFERTFVGGQFFFQCYPISHFERTFVANPKFWLGWWMLLVHHTYHIWRVNEDQPTHHAPHPLTKQWRVKPKGFVI